jgi:hypothetical protein
MGKGADFERTLAKQFSLWWTQGVRDDVFWRTSQSGGRATQRNKKGQATANSHGDMTTIDSIGEPFTSYFLLEFKRGYTKDLDVLTFVDTKRKSLLLFDFWFKAEQDRVAAGRKQSLLVFKRDRFQVCVFFNGSFFWKLQRTYGPLCRNYIRMQSDQEEEGSFIIFLLEDFFNWVDPKSFHLVIEDKND